jgi:spore cortex formation protein SpoVR/YcgB (stage V sporulation)
VERSELEKCKSDIVYFAEKVLGYDLQPWQKELLKLHQQGVKLYYTGFRYGKNMVVDAIQEHNKLIN